MFITDDEKLQEWSLNVKIRARWSCESCGELDRKLLEAHHIKPVHLFPGLRYVFSNGKCLCLWCHAWKGHPDNEGIRNKILARLCVILVLRHYPERRQDGHSVQ